MIMDYCDYDAPEFYYEKHVLAAKNHACCECSKPIKKGDKYFRCVGKWEGHVITEKQHERCFHFARWLNHDSKISDDNGCIPFGGIDECLQYEDNVDEEQKLWSQVANGLDFQPPFGSSMRKHAIRDKYIVGP